MKKNEKPIRIDVREYIIEQVNSTLARLGVNQPLKEGINETTFETKPITQFPMMFKEVVVECRLIDITENATGYDNATKEEYNIIYVYLQYKYQLFSNCGSNGCKIGSMKFLVDKDLPAIGKDLSMYIQKEKGLMI